LQDWALVFQGYADPAYKARLKSVVHDSRLGNVFVSDSTYADIAMLDPLVASCDAGIAWYNDISAGFRTAGQSSGKIVSYLRCGLPVVAKAYPSTRLAIEATGCGRCVATIDDIPEAMRAIESSYDEFSARARCDYETTYRFERYEQALLAFLAATPWGGGEHRVRTPPATITQ
jgi:glycosyltransferase involved in cell wall biosynthesis